MKDEEYQKQKQTTIDLFKLAFRTINPWRKNMIGSYFDGWNACITEIKKNQKDYIKKLEEL